MALLPNRAGDVVACEEAESPLLAGVAMPRRIDTLVGNAAMASAMGDDRVLRV